MKIGFVGLGHMGHPMAHNLIKAGLSVTVFDIASKAMDSLVSLGAKSATSLSELAKQSDVIFTMLQNGEQVKSACLSPDGIFLQCKPDTLFIDCSSIDIVTTKELHKNALSFSIEMLDAPVSGGVAGAEKGALTFMVGGDAKTFARAEPILKHMGKKIVHAGKAGSGQAAKICNNLILGISMMAVSEGFALAQKLGLDPKKFFEISSNASGQCWSMTSYCPVPGIIPEAPSNREYKPGFASSMMLKDLRLAQHAAETVNGVIPLTSEAVEWYTKFVNDGNGELDFSGIIRMLN